MLINTFISLYLIVLIFFFFNKENSVILLQENCNIDSNIESNILYMQHSGGSNSLKDSKIQIETEESMPGIIKDLNSIPPFQKELREDKINSIVEQIVTYYYAGGNVNNLQLSTTLFYRKDITNIKNKVERKIEAEVFDPTHSVEDTFTVVINNSGKGNGTGNSMVSGWSPDNNQNSSNNTNNTTILEKLLLSILTFFNYIIDNILEIINFFN